MIALALFAAAVGAPLLSRRLTGDLFSPVAIVISAWCGTLSLLALGLLPYQPLAERTLWFLGSLVVALAAGAAAGTILAGRVAPGHPAPDVRLERPAVVVNVAALLGLLGVGWFVWTVVTTLGWEAFNQGPELRHKLGSYQVSSRYLFLQFFCVIAPLLAWALALTGVRFTWWQLVVPVLAGVGTLVTTDRTQFFTVLLSGFFAYCFRRGPKLPLWRFAVLAVVGPVVLLANFILIGIWTGRTAATTLVTLELPQASAGTFERRVFDALQHGAVAYLYATCSYPALDRLLAAPPAATAGAHTFYPVVRLLQRAGLVDVALPSAIPAFVRIERPGASPLLANTYTFAYYPREDFGDRGAVIYGAVLGMLAGWVYGWARRRRASAARVLVIGQLGTALALTFFVNKFNNSASWYFFFWTLAPFVVTWALARLRRPPPRAAG